MKFKMERRGKQSCDRLCLVMSAKTRDVRLSGLTRATFYRKVKKIKEEQGRNYEKKVAKTMLFGVSDNTRQMIQILRGYGYEPAWVIDNDERKWGSYCSGIRVYPVDSIQNDRAMTVLVYSLFVGKCSFNWRKGSGQEREILI